MSRVIRNVPKSKRGLARSICIICGMTMVILLVAAVPFVDWGRVAAWNDVRRMLSAASRVEPTQTIIRPGHGEIDARLEQDGLIFEIAAAPPGLEVDWSMGLRMESKGGRVLVIPAEEVGHIDSDVDWCMSNDVLDHERLVTLSREHWATLACSSDVTAMGASYDLRTVYYCHAVKPISLITALAMSECEWGAYAMAIVRKSQFERAVERGVEILFANDKVGVLRLGNDFMGNAVEVLVYSCEGLLEYSCIAEADSPEASRQLALKWFRALHRVR